MRILARVLAAAVVSSVTFGQPAPTAATFEIADVHLSPRTTQPRMTGGLLRGGRYELRKATMVDLIRTAYGVDADNVIGGPSWLESDRFDIIARIPPSTSPDAVNGMLQALLADRFKLIVHNDKKPVQSFVLSLGKGKPKLKESEGAGNTGCRPLPQPPAPGQIPYVIASCRNVTMAMLASELRNMANAYVTNPVIDTTELKGSWDFDLKWTPRGALGMAGADGITIFDAVDHQLGLKLEPQKVSTAVVVVDSVNQKPTDNPPGVAQRLPPPPPAEFEVADIKPSAPGAQQEGGGFQPGGRIDLHSIPLKMLISLAWDLDPREPIAGEPKWLSTARFDVVAKAATSGAASTNGPPIDIDDLRAMVRALIKDRFKMTSHYEDRAVTAYTLTAAKPKLKKADPANRTACKVGLAPATKEQTEPGPPTLLATCQNMTMAQLADQFSTIAPMYTRYPVVDATGIDGAWDFGVTFSPIPPGQLAAFRGGPGGRGGPPGGGPEPAPPAAGGFTASDPSGAVSLFDAINKQLGLKLEPQKRPMPVLVIDHIEEKPTDN